MPVTLDGGGVLYSTRDPVHVAGLIEAIVSGDALRQSVIEAQDAALERLVNRDFCGTLVGFVEQVRRQAEDRKFEVFILRMKNARHLDASTAMALEGLVESLHATNRHLLISGVSEDVHRVLSSSGVLDTIGPANVFPAEANPTISTKHALERATELLHTKEADVRIFYDRPQR